jgi:hypothetical protein
VKVRGAPDEDVPLPTGPSAKSQLDDPRQWPLLDAVAARWDGRSLVQDIGLPPIVELNVKLTVDLDQWRTGFLAVREFDPPPHLISMIREVAPQALLRDLHRPVLEFYFAPEVREGSYRPPLTEAYRTIRAAQVREPRPEIEPITRVVREQQERRRKFLAEQWRPIKSDDVARDRIQLAGGIPPVNYGTPGDDSEGEGGDDDRGSGGGRGRHHGGDEDDE